MNLMDAEITIYDVLAILGILWGLIKIFFGQDKKLDRMETKVGSLVDENTNLKNEIEKLRSSKSSMEQRLKTEMEKESARIYKDMAKVELRHDEEFKEIKRHLELMPERIVALLKK